MEKIKQIRSQISYEVFEDQDFHLVNRHLSTSAQHSLLSRLLNKGDLKKVSRGLYVFDELWRRKPLSKFSIANKLLSPSYISFESALSHHGLIPESVYGTTSACFQPENKSFKTPFGDFSYHHIPTAAFSLEVESLVTPSGPQLIASPLKALFDLVYARRKNYESLADIEQDLRISPDELMKHARVLSIPGLEELAMAYHKKTCLALLVLLKKELR